jgi:D-3-phosphoglycerate dehydrogenase
MMVDAAVGTRCQVACLDVWTPGVRDVVAGAAPPELELHFAQSYDEAHQNALARDADILLPGWAAVSASMLAQAPRVRMIQKWGIGVDRIDVEAVRRRGLPLAIAAGSNAAPVAELAVALMLAVYRRITYVNRVMRLGQWPKAEMRETCFQITGKTVGLVGFGNIGRMVARRLAGFDARVIYFDARAAEPEVEARLGVRRVELAELLQASDIVSLHAPATPQTARMINAASIAAMKTGAVLINTARGELVDDGALHAALVAGKLRGAGLDAFDPEPPAASNPLLQLDQVVVTPHAGGGVFDNVEHVAHHVLGNIVRFLNGQPLAAADVYLPASDVNPAARSDG